MSRDERAHRGAMQMSAHSATGPLETERERERQSEKSFPLGNGSSSKEGIEPQ